MNIQGRKIWQQACGDKDRNYSKICLKWDVILNGPGFAGPYPECAPILRNNNRSAKKITDIRRFATEMKSGDLVVLRIGTSTIFAFGEIVGDYEWHDSFSDVDGWDLQHVRRVRWLWNGIKNPKHFKIYALKQGDTTQILNSPEVVKWIETMTINSVGLNRILPGLPKAGKKIDQEEIAEYLFNRGVSSQSIRNLMNEFDELERIARWYMNQRTRPSEYETISYLVVPILRALGWTPQKMAVEWKKVDLALFDQLPRNNANLSVVVEAKKKDMSCLSAISQAQGYAKGKSNCQRLIVTDGLRYGIYIKDNEDYVMRAYFNLTSLRESYPIYECDGIKEALTIMTPEWREN